MNTPFGDFCIAPEYNENSVDMTFRTKLNLSHFESMKSGNNIEEYKKQCNYQERIVLLYFCKALGAYKAMKKMLTLQDKYGTIVNHRVDSDIITKTALQDYINEIYTSFFDANVALEFLSAENLGINNIFLKIVQNSETDFVSGMAKVAYNERVSINGL